MSCCIQIYYLIHRFYSRPY